MERGIHSSGSGVPAPVDLERPSEEDALRSAIAEQCNRKEPTPAVQVYTQQAWQEQFERPWIIPNERYLRTSTEVAGGGGHIFCRACAKPKKHGKFAAFKMHVSIEYTDPMQVYKHGIITLECHGCGFEMIAARKQSISGHDASGMFMDEFSNLDQSKIQSMLAQKHAAQQMREQLSNYGYAQQNAMNQQGIGVAHGNAMAAQSNEQLELIHRLRERGIVDEQRLEEFVRHHLHEAEARVQAAAAPLPVAKKKGFFG